MGQNQDVKTENEEYRKVAAFLLVKTNLNSRKVLDSFKNEKLVRWSNCVYGPYQIVLYLEADSEDEIKSFVEELREKRKVVDLDARIVKRIPEDINLRGFQITKSNTAILLINVNYKDERERIVTCNLRDLEGVKLSRAMWGPADIIVIVEADDPESMRNLICDEIKVMNGVMSNTTLYCY